MQDVMRINSYFVNVRGTASGSTRSVCVPICSLEGWYRGIALVAECTIKIRRGLSLDGLSTTNTRIESEFYRGKQQRLAHESEKGSGGGKIILSMCPPAMLTVIMPRVYIPLTHLTGISL